MWVVVWLIAAKLHSPTTQDTLIRTLYDDAILVITFLAIHYDSVT